MTEGKTNSEIGRVVIVVAIGDSFHSTNALLTMKKAPPKQAQITDNQVNLAAKDFAEDMW